jgi:hypothetical protein
LAGCHGAKYLKYLTALLQAAWLDRTSAMAWASVRFNLNSETPLALITPGLSR